MEHNDTEPGLFEVGAKAVIVRDGRVLLLERPTWNYKNASTYWDLPGGRIGEREPLELALERELEEEIGYRGPVEITGTLSHQLWAPDDYDGHPKILLFLNVRCEIDSVTLSPEHRSYVWADLDDLDSLDPRVILEPELEAALVSLTDRKPES